MSYHSQYQDSKYHGLMNQGATCYLNSVLQVLFMTKGFRNAVQRNTSGDHIDVQLALLFKKLKTQTAQTVQVTDKLGIVRVCEQRDAAEHFEKILTLTSDDAAKIFRGKLEHITICSGCGTETDEDAAFWDLPLALVNTCDENYSVKDGIREFFKDSDFSGENQMYCDNCCNKCDATAKCVIKHHPEVLMLLLKRFEFSYKQMSFVKNDCVVDVPSILKIPENQMYELYGFVEHFGSLNGGHYTATIKDDEEGRWYCFNDSSVTLLNNKPFQKHETERTRTAYLLFYRKKNTGTLDIRQESNTEDLTFNTNKNYEQQQDVCKIVSGGDYEYVDQGKSRSGDVRPERKGSNGERWDPRDRKQNKDKGRKNEEDDEEKGIEGKTEAIDQTERQRDETSTSKRRKVEANTDNDGKTGHNEQGQEIKIPRKEVQTEEMSPKNDEQIEKQESRTFARENTNVDFRVQDIPMNSQVGIRDKKPTEHEQQGRRKINVQADNKQMTRVDKNTQRDDRVVTKPQTFRHEYGDQGKSRSGDVRPKQKTSAPKTQKDGKAHKPSKDEGNKEDDEHNQIRVDPPTQVGSGNQAAGNDDKSNIENSQSKEKKRDWFKRPKWLKGKPSKKDSDGSQRGAGNRTSGTGNGKPEKNKSKKNNFWMSSKEKKSVDQEDD